MADPIGTPTFLQIFSPAKSPFHALALFALVCVYVISDKPLAYFGTGLVMILLLGAFLLAPFFRPHYSARVYGLSLMFGRTAGLIGAMVALAILISKSGADPAGQAKRLLPDSMMFRSIWWQIVIWAAAMACLFFTKTGSHDGEVPRYNIVQFCLMQSVLLVAIVVFATNRPVTFATVEQFGSGGAGVWLASVTQASTGAQIAPELIAPALMLLWYASAAVNALLIFYVVRLGWVSDHGEGKHD